MKYIIFQGSNQSEFPVLFPDHIGHDFIRNSVNSHYPGVTPVRAGFCNSNGACWGESVSLKLKSDMAQDEWLMKKAFNKD